MVTNLNIPYPTFYVLIISKHRNQKEKNIWSQSFIFGVWRGGLRFRTKMEAEIQTVNSFDAYKHKFLILPRLSDFRKCLQLINFLRKSSVSQAYICLCSGNNAVLSEKVDEC